MTGAGFLAAIVASCILWALLYLGFALLGQPALWGYGAAALVALWLSGKLA